MRGISGPLLLFFHRLMILLDFVTLEEGFSLSVIIMRLLSDDFGHICTHVVFHLQYQTIDIRMKKLHITLHSLKVLKDVYRKLVNFVLGLLLLLSELSFH